MVRSLLPEDNWDEEMVAELAEAAYHAALRHGLKGSFVDAELDIWRAVRKVLARRGPLSQEEEVLCAR